MKVQVLFFASLREAMGVESVGLSLTEGSVTELRAALKEALGELSLQLWADNVRVARNQELLSALSLDALVLADRDELAFLPPVTGG